MQENVGRTDRIVRSIVGPSLTVAGAMLLRRGNLVGGAIGLVVGTGLIHTAITRVCPVNWLLGIDTRSQEERLRDSRVALREETDRTTKVWVSPEPASDAARLA